MANGSKSLVVNDQDFGSKSENTVRQWWGRRDSDPSRRLRNVETVDFRSSLSLNWLDVRTAFIDYLGARGYDARVAKDYVSYLDKHVPSLSGPFDVISLFTKVKSAKRHVAMSLRVLFNFYEMLGYDKGFLDSLRKALPKVQCGIDLKIPSEEKIVDSLRKSGRAPLKYRALYNLLLDSGLRLVEAVALINSFRDAETINGFYRCELAMFRVLINKSSAKPTIMRRGKMKNTLDSGCRQCASVRGG